MNIRLQLSVALVLAGMLLAMLPLRETRSFMVNPEKLLSQSLNESTVITVDQVARLLVSEDSSLNLIDLRPAEEFREFSIPGAINIPYSEIAGIDPETFLRKGNAKNIFYSNGDVNSAYALVIAGGFGFMNCAIMDGGMNEWIRTVMNSRFSGERISARENALFEARANAGRLFTEFNSLPDSLKLKYLESKRFDPVKLDGGCE
jgi:3-mercaptopyruvate sulfurtransferase SseA